ncbi:tRNA (adenosine(37)-N6)-threonylcarbamoyltransferase complex dimerization subunit type 1 TsaB [Thiomicrorhabdus sp. Kp2]|uniref:tRNA (adenosine(37)-N6)-threonylcarbamoyltransferase complex dimerization subunit type 1 TsaB n=1 Tax=Thiomicrorhabdus sp. Kp2 TaxID=1123518 RepID=UPI000687AA2F|nr:tRNA (adenosine(37)-N6)-threonylcarbamoyltransferase complex dimerization subunit type 1 TsaB [Thiomicrorhabdus sp. Kp2]
MSRIQLPSVLAVETSTQACSVALIYLNKEYVRHELLPQKHAHRVLEMIDEVMQEAGIDHQEIDLLAYGEGPGAFTGVRIASGVIQGLALGWDKPVLPVSSLLAMAENVFSNYSDTKDIKWCSLLDARMSEVYLLQGDFTAKTKTINAIKPILISPKEVVNYLPQKEPCIGVGDIEGEYPEISNLFNLWYSKLPEAISIARMAQNRFVEGKTLLQEIPNPIYLRNHIADTIEERKMKAQLKQS